MGSYILKKHMSRQDPWFWEDGIPYDEFVLACWIANEGAVEALVKELTEGKALFRDRPSHEAIIHFVQSFARRASKRLRSGK